jgi:hypothetical protein
MLFTDMTLLTPRVVAPKDSGADLEDNQAWIGKMYNARAEAHMLNDAGSMEHFEEMANSN